MNLKVNLTFVFLMVIAFENHVEAGWFDKIGDVLAKAESDVRREASRAAENVRDEYQRAETRLKEADIGKELHKAAVDAGKAAKEAEPYVKIAADIYSVLNGIPPVHRLFIKD